LHDFISVELDASYRTGGRIVGEITRGNQNPD